MNKILDNEFFDSVDLKNTLNLRDKIGEVLKGDGVLVNSLGDSIHEIKLESDLSDVDLSNNIVDLKLKTKEVQGKKKF